MQPRLKRREQRVHRWALLRAVWIAAVIIAAPALGQHATPWQLPSTHSYAQNDAPRPAATTAPGDSRVESYPLTASTRDVLVAWQRNTAGRNDIRVAMDERSSQVLVYGPAAVHEQIRRALFQTDPPQGNVATAGGERAAAPANLPAAERDASPQRTSAQVQLRRLLTTELHQRIERLLARPLPATADASGQWQGILLETAPGVAVTMSFHGQANVVRIDGPATQVAAWRSVVEALDNPSASGSVTQLVTTKPASHQQVRKALQVLQANRGGLNPQPSLVSMLFQQEEDVAEDEAAQPGAAQNQPETEPAQPERQVPPDAQTAIEAARIAEEAGGLLGPVQVEFVEGLDVIVLRGAERDVQRVMEIINQIEQLSVETVPTIEVHPLQNIDSRSMATLLQRLYEDVLGPRVGDVSITPLVKPNALLLIGRDENVRAAIELIQRLDQPVPPTTRFEVFPLKYASAPQAKQLIDAFFQQEDEAEAEEGPATLAPNALVVVDFRTNSLVVSAGPRDMAEVAALIARIDTPAAAAVDVVRVFPLRNALATELAEVLQEAIEGQQAEELEEVGGRPSALEFLTIGGELRSGVLTNVRIAAEPRQNALVVTAPPESMDLLAALIAQLDQAPSAVAELKVFTLTNGDATALANMLRTLFGTEADADAAEPGGVGQGGLVRLQISVDPRTNSIIAAGTREDLAVVEAILLRLDQGDIRERITTVHRLNNAFAQDVALALNQWLQTERTVEAEAEVVISPFEQIEREVIIVPEPATNSLIVSATPRFYDEVVEIIRELDERPPMVMIQVLIAEVRLNDTDEFGVELGLQDSLLFDRSLVGELTTITRTTQEQGAGGAVLTTTEEQIVNAPLNPGFNFNNQPLGNNGSTAALATAGQVAAQGLSSFALNRLNGDLGFGGLVLSASSSSVSMLLRALQENRRLEVLSRPQIMALDGQLGQVQVGQNVPTITGVTFTEFGQTNAIIYRPVGLILQVLPRISPDGLVVMQILANKSEVGPEAEGIPISISPTGEILRAPRIENTEAITTVSALSGQTVVLSGLLATRKFDVHRSVPLISEIPLIGDLFRYDLVSEERRELLIILTPQIVYDRRDSERLKQVESARMSWILADVMSLNGPSGLRSRCDEWFDFEAETIYPMCVPSAEEMPPPNGGVVPYGNGEPLPMDTAPMELAPPPPAPVNGEVLPGAVPRASPPAPVPPPTSDRYAPALVTPASYGSTTRLPQTTSAQ